MEVDSEGHCDSDVSDSWSIVEFKADESAGLKTSTDLNLPAEPVHKDGLTDGLDECYELTELSLPPADALSAALKKLESQDPVAHFNPAHIKRTLENDSDVDTDGISVISEDEEYVNWKQAAHDNYRNTMRLLETSPETSPNRVITALSAKIAPEEDIMEPQESAITVQEKEQEQTCLKSDSEPAGMELELSDPGPESEEIEREPSATQGSSDVHFNPRVECLLAEKDGWPHCLAQFVSKHFFTSAVIAAIACIALAQFFKTGTGKEKVVEMLEVLEKLKGENELLKLQLQDLTKAYASLEARVMSNQVPPRPSPTPEASSTPGDKLGTSRASTVLPLLIKFAEGKHPQLEAIVNRLEQQFHQIPADLMTEELQAVEQKVVNCAGKLLKKGTFDSELVRRLSDLGGKLQRKINRKNKMKQNKIREKVDDGLKIVQWFPEVEDAFVERPTDSSETLGSFPTRSHPEVVPNTEKGDKVDNFEPKISATKPISQEAESNFVMHERSQKIDGINSPQDDFEPSRNSEPRIVKISSKSPTDDLKASKASFCSNSKKVCKQAKKYEKRGKGFKMRPYPVRNTCEQRLNKTGAWYLERGRDRENIRRADQQGEWQFARGRRDLQKEAEEKSLWYLRKLELHPRSRE